jgi:hypothetical protein
MCCNVATEPEKNDAPSFDAQTIESRAAAAFEQFDSDGNAALKGTLDVQEFTEAFGHGLGLAKRDMGHLSATEQEWAENNCFGLHDGELCKLEASLFSRHGCIWDGLL